MVIFLVFLIYALALACLNLLGALVFVLHREDRQWRGQVRDNDPRPSRSASRARVTTAAAPRRTAGSGQYWHAETGTWAGYPADNCSHCRTVREIRAQSRRRRGW